MKIRQFAALAVVLAIALLSSSCFNSDGATVVQVVVGPHFESTADGLNPGDPLDGGVVRVYRGDAVIFETPLDSDGAATVEAPTGTYTIQVERDSAGSEGFCFWGNTVQGVSLPTATLLIEAAHICAGA